MKLKKYIFTTIGAGLIGLFTSCNDWLDVQPKTSIPSDKLFESEAGFIDAFTGLYLKLTSPTLYAHDLTYGYVEEMAGVYNSYPGYMTDQYGWKNHLYEFDDTFLSKINSIYLEMYNTLSNLNNFLKNVEEGHENGVLRTDRYYELMKGEALGLRAFIHFDLLRLFGPVYKVNPAGKAIPYRTSFDAVATPVLSANEVLERVLADLTEAERILTDVEPGYFFTSQYDHTESDVFLTNRQFRMNLYAVKAMLARVYNYKADAASRALALQYAQEVIEATKDGENLFNLYEMQSANNYSPARYREQIFGLSVYELDKVLDDYGMQMSTSAIDQNRYIISDELYQAFYDPKGVGSTDWRAGDYALAPEPNRESPNRYVFKYNQSAPDSEGVDAMPLIRLPEMYYIIAECATDGQSSVDALNTVRLARGISSSDLLEAGDFYDKPDTRADCDDPAQTYRINEVMSEYRKEYLAEGQLFFFFKAHHYKTFKGCPVDDMSSHYQWPLPDNETIFGNNSK